MAIHIDTDGNFYFGASGTTDFNSLSYTPVFSVTKDGVVTAISGTIGGWTLGSDYLRAQNSSNQYIYLNADGSIAGNFISGTQGWRINASGDAEFNDVTIRGDLLGVELKGEMVFNNGEMKTSTSGRRVEITDNNNTEGEIRFETNSGTTARLVADANTEFAIEQSALTGGKIKLITGVLSNGLEFTANEINFTTPLAFNNPVIKLNGTNANSAGTSSLSKVLGVDSSGRLSVATPTTGGVYSSFISINSLTMQSGFNYDIEAASGAKVSVSTQSSPTYKTIINHSDSDHNYNIPTIPNLSIGTGGPFISSVSGHTLNGKASSSDLGSINPANTYFTPNNINYYGSTVGTGSRRWAEVHVGDLIEYSDVNLKYDIEDSSLGLDFINNLRPVAYKQLYTNDYSEIDEYGNSAIAEPKAGVNKHYGFIAQEVKQVMDDMSLTHQDFAGHIPDYGSGESLRYREIFAVAVKAIQELSTQISDLTARVEALEG